MCRGGSAADLITDKELVDRVFVMRHKLHELLLLLLRKDFPDRLVHEVHVRESESFEGLRLQALHATGEESQFKRLAAVLPEQFWNSELRSLRWREVEDGRKGLCQFF